MPNPTPYPAGPWVIEPLQATHGADLAIVGGSKDDRTVVCVIQHDPDIQDEEEEYIDGDNVKWHPDQMPAARLIAAAPALVEALEDALLASGYGVAAPIPDSVRYSVPAWVFVARKLLAEVKGQPHA